MTAKVIFLGTGGGRHTTMFQARSTGGFILDTGTRIHVDPGPGALTNMCLIRYNLERTDAVVISHCHPDHYSDAEIVIEGMGKGGWVHRGEVYGSVSVMEGQNGLGPCISEYHKRIPKMCCTIRAGDVCDIAGVRTEIMTADHSDPTNVGFRFHTENGVLAYVSDTAYSDTIADQYIGSKVLILPVTTPNENRIRGHLCTADAGKFIERVRPELAIFVHLGIVMLRSGPAAQAAMVENATGVRTIAGEDLMTLDLEDLSVGHITPSKPDWSKDWEL
ncbi:MAG: MBL fold metallo-hydrolase [Candidatus Methanomethylophilaceae archaeon]